MINVWTIQPIWRLSPTSFDVPFSVSASLRVFSLSLFFAVVGFDVFASKPVYSRGLRYVSDSTPISYAPVVRRVFYFSSSPHSDLDLWPWLSGWNNRYESSNGLWFYWEAGYNESKAPYKYVPTNGSVYFQVPDDWSDDDLFRIQATYDDKSLAVQAAITGFEAYNEVSGTVTNRKFHTLVQLPGIATGGGITTYNSFGEIEVRYPESDGYVHGYRQVGPGQYEPIYYDYVNNHVVELTTINSVNSSSLSYDPDTGRYDISIPDYSTAIAGIARDVEAIRNNPFLVDLSGMEIPPPVVTVNPEITVNPPDVTVNPQVTVNPTVTVTPDVTVNVNPSVSLPSEINVGLSDEGYQDVVDIINESDLSSSVATLANAFVDTTQVEDFDTTPSSMSQDEQDIIDVVQGWNTQIPAISNVCNVAFNSILGTIPSIPQSDLVPLSGISVFGFDIVIDLRPYATLFQWFRAFVLVLEIIWFVDCLWRTAVKVLQV